MPDLRFSAGGAGGLVTNQVTTPSDDGRRSQLQPDTDYSLDLAVSDPVRRGQTDSPGMACKRSAVRARLAPPEVPGQGADPGSSRWVPRSVDRHSTVVLDVTGWQ